MHTIFRLIKARILKFFSVGAVSTLVDWFVFYVLAVLLGGHSIVVVIISYGAGALVNYGLNKTYTFHSKTKKIAMQFPVFSSFVLISLGLNALLMYVAVYLFGLEQMVSRILTTFAVFLFNYAAHNNVTFNKRFFD